VSRPRVGEPGTPEPVVRGLRGAPAADAHRSEWEQYARGHGIDPGAYATTDELIVALQPAEGHSRRDWVARLLGPRW
jgi:hypothetical protein